MPPEPAVKQPIDTILIPLSPERRLNTPGAIPKSKLAEQVVGILKRMILAAGLREGDRLPPERKLAASFGVSRRVIREALDVLVSEGIVAKQQGRGIFLNAFEEHRLRDEPATGVLLFRDRSYLYDVRVAIEMGSACLAAENATEADLADLEAIVDSMLSRIRRKESLAAEDMQFHLSLLRATHTRAFQKLDHLVAEALRLKLYHRPHLFYHSSGAQTVAEHQAIVDALRARDSIRAMLEMYNSLNDLFDGPFFGAGSA